MTIKDFVKNVKGFTLVELVIVILIIVILSAISGPIYKGHIAKAMRAEGYTLIANIRDAQMLYRTEYGNFYSRHPNAAYAGTSYDITLGINAKFNKYFTWFSITSSNPSYVYDLRCSLPEQLKRANYKNLYFYFNLTSGSVTSIV